MLQRFVICQTAVPSTRNLAVTVQSLSVKSDAALVNCCHDAFSYLSSGFQARACAADCFAGDDFVPTFGRLEQHLTHCCFM